MNKYIAIYVRRSVSDKEKETIHFPFLHRSLTVSDLSERRLFTRFTRKTENRART